jgi:chitosanase
MHYITATTLLSLGLASAYDIPDNLKQIYNNHKVKPPN